VFTIPGPAAGGFLPPRVRDTGPHTGEVSAECARATLLPMIGQRRRPVGDRRASVTRAWRRTLFVKAAVLLLSILAVVAVATAVVFSRSLAAQFRGELDERGSSLLHTLERHQDLHLAIGLRDRTSVQRVLGEVLAANRDARYLGAVDAQGDVLAAVARDGGDAAAIVRAELRRHGLDGSGPGSDDDHRRFTEPVVEAAAPGGALEPPGTGPGTARVLGHLVLGLDAARIGSQAAQITVKTVLTASVALLVAFLAFFWIIARRTMRMVAFAEALAACDLSAALEDHVDDELGRLAQALLRLRENTAAVVRQLREASGALRGASGEVLSGAESQLALARGQADAVRDAGAVVDRLREAAQQAGTTAEGVVTVAHATEDSTRTGRAAVDEAVAAIVAMRDQAEGMASTVVGLVEKTAHIGAIMEALQDLAEQSSVLSLNASIEAARAGEAGRGFAVVAAEVRSLADQSRGATAQVQKIVGDVHKAARASLAVVEESRARAQEASRLAASSGEAIRRLAAAIGESWSAADQIAGSTRAQGEEVARIWSAMQDVDRATREAQAGIAQLRDASQSIAQHADRMQGIVSLYRVDGVPE